jgi:hypothetical protein
LEAVQDTEDKTRLKVLPTNWKTGGLARMRNKMAKIMVAANGVNAPVDGSRSVGHDQLLVVEAG